MSTCYAEISKPSLSSQQPVAILRPFFVVLRTFFFFFCVSKLKENTREIVCSCSSSPLVASSRSFVPSPRLFIVFVLLREHVRSRRRKRENERDTHTHTYTPFREGNGRTTRQKKPTQQHARLTLVHTTKDCSRSTQLNTSGWLKSTNLSSPCFLYVKRHHTGMWCQDVLRSAIWRYNLKPSYS